MKIWVVSRTCPWEDVLSISLPGKTLAFQRHVPRNHQQLLKTKNKRISICYFLKSFQIIFIIFLINLKLSKIILWFSQSVIFFELIDPFYSILLWLVIYRKGRIANMKETITTHPSLKVWKTEKEINIHLVSCLNPLSQSIHLQTGSSGQIVFQDLGGMIAVRTERKGNKFSQTPGFKKKAFFTKYLSPSLYVIVPPAIQSL